MDWAKIREKLAIEQEMTDENAESLILARADEMLEKVLALSHEEEETVTDPRLIALTKKDRTRTLADLMAAGRVTKATHDKLAATYCSDLALAHSDDNFDAVMEALKDNSPVQIAKEHSGPQTLELSHTGQDCGEPTLVKKAKALAAKKEATK